MRPPPAANAAPWVAGGTMGVASRISTESTRRGPMTTPIWRAMCSGVPGPKETAVWHLLK